MKKYILLFTTSLLLTFCNNFDELNVDPNNPSSADVVPHQVLGRILKQSTFSFHLHQRIHNLYADLFSQYYMCTTFSSYEYRSHDGWTEDYWSDHYAWFHNLGKLLEEPETGNFTINDRQLARIWRVWITHRAVDLMGDIPYFNKEGIYNSEEDIYKDMLKELKVAVDSLDGNVDMYNGMFALYDGNTNLWKKFANSLRLRLAMRLTNVNLDLAKSHAEEAVEGGVLELNEETPYMPPTGVWGEGYSYYMYLGWNTGTVLSESANKTMTGIGGIGFNKNDVDAVKDGKYPEMIDPRATIIFNSTPKPEDDDDDDEYKAIWSSIPMGLSLEDRNSPRYLEQNNSRINKTLQNSNRDFTVMPVAEVWFLRAEGATYGWDMGVSTKDAYENGVKTSFEYWGLEENLANTYLASSETNDYGVSANWEDNNNGEPLEKIMTQKYIGGYPDNGFEAWADLRRLELPKMDFGENQFNSAVPKGKVIQRVRYPSNQAILNTKNYSQVSANDNEGRKHWWSKQD